MKTQITLGGIIIKRPAELSINRYHLTKADRNAKGNMVMDYINTKTEFDVTWPVIDTKEIKKLQDLLYPNTGTPNLFLTMDWIEDNVTHSCTVYAGAFKKDLARSSGMPGNGSWFWKDFALHLIEK
jgi:hypothetical protein